MVDGSWVLMLDAGGSWILGGTRQQVRRILDSDGGSWILMMDDEGSWGEPDSMQVRAGGGGALRSTPPVKLCT